MESNILDLVNRYRNHAPQIYYTDPCGKHWLSFLYEISARQSVNDVFSGSAEQSCQRCKKYHSMTSLLYLQFQSAAEDN